MLKLTDRQWERIRHHFPEERRKAGRRGRPPVPAREALEAVLWILKTGAQWHMLPQCYPNHGTVHRRFRTWCRTGVPEAVLADVASELRDLGAIKLSEGFIDASFVRAKGGGPDVGKTKLGKGMKIMAVADSGGLPLAIGVEPSNRAECRLVQLTLDLSFCGEPPNPIGDKAYDSDPLDAELRERGVEMIAPHRRNRTRAKTRDGRRLRRYRRRWLVERLFAWLQWRRRLLVRWEYYTENFLGLVRLAVLCLFLKHF